VAATCHIGPLDADETKGYIEHRLKCAGATDKPSFEPAAFEMIHKYSNGIPRRINAICDRLLLLGFLSERSHLTAADVEEVNREFAEEARVPGKPQGADGDDDAVNGNPAVPGAPTDVDLSSLQLDPGVARGITRQLEALGASHYIDQMQRLERSVLRLERVNVQTLGMLKSLVKAVKKAPGEEDR
jgi:hypothetical protein